MTPTVFQCFPKWPKLSKILVWSKTYGMWDFCSQKRWNSKGTIFWLTCHAHFTLLCWQVALLCYCSDGSSSSSQKSKKKVCSVAVDFTGNHSFSMIIILLMMLIYLVYMEIFPHLHHHYKSMYNMFLEMVNPQVGVQNLTKKATSIVE